MYIHKIEFKNSSFVIIYTLLCVECSCIISPQCHDIVDPTVWPIMGTHDSYSLAMLYMLDDLK